MNLEELVRELYTAKAAESEAMERRINLELAVAKSLVDSGDWPDEGSRTVKLAGIAKLSVSQPIYRKVDPDAYRRLLDEAGGADALAGMNPVRVKEVHEVVDKEARRIAQENPTAWAWWSKAITETPGKPSVKVELL